MKQEFEKIEINGIDALFTNNEINRNEIPQGYFAYDIREGDNDNAFSTIEHRVLVNRAGTILTTYKIEMNSSAPDDYIVIEDINFLGENTEIDL